MKWKKLFEVITSSAKEKHKDTQVIPLIQMAIKAKHERVIFDKM